MKFKILITALTLFLVSGTAVSAKEICFTQYGGGEECIDVDEDAKIDVDKKVSKDKNDHYEDHLKASVHTFDAGDKVYFKITVKNKGDVTLKDVELTDTLPSFLKFHSEIDGDADVDGKKVKFDLGTLEPGESETVKFAAEVADDEDLPKDDKVCLTNIAEAQGKRKDKNDKEKDSDYANFCIDLPDIKGEKPTQLPKAGAGGVLALFGVISTLAGSLINRRLNNNA